MNSTGSKIPPIEERISNSPCKDSECAYRGINTLHWNPNERIISSSAFRNPAGVSVDIAKGRTENECVEHMKKFGSWEVIGKVEVAFINSLDLACFEDQIGGFGNDYHALILNTDKTPFKSRGKAKKLAMNAKVITV